MKSWLAGLVFSVILFVPVLTAHAVYVHGYTKSNGTYVQGYERTAPDGNPFNNYSYPGNYNPNTGSITGGSAAAYLNNYYKNSSGSYGYSSYLSTPTCPLNSYYDGISSCKCNYGYASSNGSCISQDSLCHTQLGYSSSYDSLTNSCKCDYGNVIGSSGLCTSGTLYCADKIGLMSNYDSLSNTCKCMTGYSLVGSTCTYNNSPSYRYPSYSPSSCPINSSQSLTDSTKCNCNTGYQPSSTKDSCVLAASSQTNQQMCQSSFGFNSIWNGTTNSDGTVNCICQSGYKWNSGKSLCVSI